MSTRCRSASTPATNSAGVKLQWPQRSTYACRSKLLLPAPEAEALDRRACLAAGIVEAVDAGNKLEVLEDKAKLVTRGCVRPYEPQTQREHAERER